MNIKHIAQTAVLLICGFAFIASAKADNITIASAGTAVDPGQTNSDGATIAITPDGAWATALPGSSWVSFGSTGSSSAPGYFVVPNGTVVSFFDVFDVPGIPTGGSISVLADDSASIYLNGVLIASEASSTGNTYATCSDFGIGCLVATTINLPASDLNTGSNTLEFNVAQRNGAAFGLDYFGTVTDPSASVPEPGLALLMMIGLVGVGGGSFLRKSNQQLEQREKMNRDTDIPASFFTDSRANTPPSAELDEFEIRRRAFFS